MSHDLLGEALARWEGWEMGDPYDPGTLDQLLAAARNWHTLTERSEPTPRMWEVLNAVAAFGHPGGSRTLWNELQEAAVDVKSGTRYKIVLVDARANA